MFKSEKKYYQKSFLVALAMAAAMLLPFVIADGGYFLLCGDYNAQQIPFFKHSVEMVHNGTFGWDWQTDIGANFIGSYTYYTLGSPFFWFMTLFPAAISEYLMAPLLCVKIALFSLFGFMYIRRFVAKPQTALIGGILYAFSSFNLYNIFFQFQDAIIWFPLLLIGLEEAVVNKRRGLFALVVALNCLANYFFFIGECVFLVIYFLCRFAMDKRFDVRLRDFFVLAFESVVGVMIAGILFIPSIYQVLDVPRSTNILTDWDFLFYGREQRYALILEGMFFPPEVAARNNLFTEAGAKWSSVALYLPLFSMAGVIAFVKGAKGHWARVLIVVCAFMSFVPGLNAAFTLFNNNFYTRWWYMFELICCLVTVYTLENEEFDLKFGFRSCCVVTFVVTVLALFSPFTQKTTVDGETESTLLPRILVGNFGNDGKASLSLEALISLVLCFGSLIILHLVLKTRKSLTQKTFMKQVTIVTVICSMMLGYYFVGYGRAIGPKLRDYNDMNSAEFDIDDDSFYRIEGVDETNNVNMLWGYSSLKSFTSIIPGSSFEFYELVGIDRTVNTAPDGDRYALRALTRVKYLMVPRNESIASPVPTKYEIYNYIDTQGDYDIYMTDYALPMGFAYDSYYLESEAKGNKKVDNLMVRAAILTEEQSEKYSDILTHEEPYYAGVINLERFKMDAANRIEEGVSDFTITTEGFTAKTDYDSEKLVVFSVPYCDGWSASINGASVEVDKINGGLCGIRVQSGVCDIVFEYETPGLRYGIYATICGLGLYVLYVLIFVVIVKNKPKKYCHMYELDRHSNVSAHTSYIRQLSCQAMKSEECGGNIPTINRHFDLENLEEKLKELDDEDKKQER